MGDGFDAAKISISFASVDNLVIEYNKIKFKTKPFTANTVPFAIKVNSLNASCKATPACQFEFSQSIAPTLASVTPTIVSGASNIQIDGTNFGTDATKLKVTIGSQNCNVSAATGTSLTCSLPGLEAGIQRIHLNLEGHF